MESLLELSEEYDMRKIKQTIEKHLLKKVSEMWNKKVYGTGILSRLEYLMSLILLSSTFGLNKLRQECVVYVASTFDKQFIEKDEYFASFESSIKIELLNKRVDVLEERLKLKEEKFKKMEDEILKQKFEIQRLNFLVNPQ